MFTVTLIGADGAGKSTLARALPGHLAMPSTYLYMGVSRSSSNRMLPTTRLLHRLKGRDEHTGGPPNPDHRTVSSAGWLDRLARQLRSAAHIGVLVSEEWYRQSISWWYRSRGYVVIYDRHFFVDYFAHDISAPTTVAQRLHGWMLSKVYPRPQLVLFLDAPAQTLHARKGEGTPGLLDRRRQEYQAIRNVLPDVVVLDATESRASVLAAAVSAIDEYREEHERAARRRAPTTSHRRTQ